VRRQDDPPIFDAGFKRVTGPNAEPSAKRARQNDLSFRGNPRLHGKTILPLQTSYHKGCQVGL